MITCGYWEVVDVVGTYCPAFKPWELLLRLLICHAMLVDVDWVSVSMTDVRLLINGLLKVAT